LLEPARYLERLANLGASSGRQPPFVVVEKILAVAERPPDEWTLRRHHRYEHAAATAGVLVDAEHAASLRDTWRTLTGDSQTSATWRTPASG